MIYGHRIDNLPTGEFEGRSPADTLQAADACLKGLIEHSRKGSLPPFLALAYAEDDLGLIEATATRIRAQAADVVILGTGGSSLGAQMMTALNGTGYSRAAKRPRLHFPDNLGPFTMDALLREIDLEHTHFIVMSKSGTTAETLAQMMACLSAIRAIKGSGGVTDHFTVIVQPGESVLRRFARRWKFKILDHDPDLGGRFSALSIIGLLPAAIAGLDIRAVREGARQVMDLAFAANQPEDVPAAVGAAAIFDLLYRQGINLNVMMPYECRLERFTAWHQQLWSESLGKSGKGTTPVRALGPVDQHSQLQLYLDGPDDKFYTFITTDMKGEGPVIDASLTTDPELGFMAGRTIGDLVAAEARATMAALVRHHRPVRHIWVKKLNEKSLGGLMMHFLLETVIAASLFEVNPYNQPSVEEGKRLTREYLEQEYGGLSGQHGANQHE
jgi:glucose-6-phosphate isomerase